MARRILAVYTTLLLILLAGDATSTPFVKPVSASLTTEKILFLGNSITLHAPKPTIGWTGNWGMAASSKGKDFVHLLTTDISNLTGSRPKIIVRNISEFERGYDDFKLTTELKSELEFNADIVVVAIGENVPELATNFERKEFEIAFAKLIAVLRLHEESSIFVRSSFWPHKVKDAIMRRASLVAGVTFIDISALGHDESNMAQSERKFEHMGVGKHPGDKGMRAIADAIFAAIQEYSGE